MPGTVGPPQNVDAEIGLLGSALINPAVLELVSLPAAAFYIHRHRMIWAAMQAVRASGQALDILTLTAELERRGQLAEVGGAAALTKLMIDTPSSMHAESYAALVMETYRNRRYLEIANQIAKSALNGGVDVAAVIDSLAETGAETGDGQHIAEGLSDLYDAVLARIADPRDVWGIPTGFVDLDKLTGGLQRQQVVLLTGESGTGKTTVLLQSALHAAQAGHGVAIFSLEMDRLRILRRLVEIISGVPNRAMLSGRMDEYMERFENAVEALRKLPIHISDDPNMSTADIRSEIARTRAQMPIAAVYLDYLGLLTDQPVERRDDNDQTKMVRFRALCRELDVAGMAIQDMTKSARDKAVPSLLDMAGGAKVRFAADTVLVMVRDADNPTAYYLVPRKTRDGDRGPEMITLYRRGLPFVSAARRAVDLSAVV